MVSSPPCTEELGAPPRWTYPGIPGGQAVGRQLLALQGALLGAVEGAIAAQWSGASKLDAQMLASGHSSIKLHCSLQAQASSGKARSPSWWGAPVVTAGRGQGAEGENVAVAVALAQVAAGAGIRSSGAPAMVTDSRQGLAFRVSFDNAKYCMCMHYGSCRRQALHASTCALCTHCTTSPSRLVFCVAGVQES